MMNYDHILIIGFGGPEKLEDVRPFLQIVAEGRNIPEERLKQVEHHYELVGGKSPYNEHIFSFQKKLQAELKDHGSDLPIYVGMRNWHPFLKDTLTTIKEAGLKKGLGFIFAPHRSIHSCYQYRQNVDDAKREAGCEAITYEIHSGFSDHELLIQANADVLETFLKANNLSKEIPVLFSAHSIPEASLAKCNQCHYQNEVEASSYQVAAKVGLKKWEVVYQSRSGNPRQPWLGPDVNDMIGLLAEQGEREVLVCPVGFFCENVEILYDLDIEAKDLAKKQDVVLHRAPTVKEDSLAQLFYQTLLQKTQASLSGC